jgi:hypothetical protein
MAETAGADSLDEAKAAFWAGGLQDGAGCFNPAKCPKRTTL